MCGRDTLTTVVSSTSMNVLSITATAMIHGLICCDCVGCEERRAESAMSRHWSIVVHAIINWMERGAREFLHSFAESGE